EAIGRALGDDQCPALAHRLPGGMTAPSGAKTGAAGPPFKNVGTSYIRPSSTNTSAPQNVEATATYKGRRRASRLRCRNHHHTANRLNSIAAATIAPAQRTCRGPGMSCIRTEAVG